MKKKILALCLVVVLAVTAVTGVTLAYFTDTETAKNVMNMGNVDIEQIEYERAYNENGELAGLQAFTQNKTLLPLGSDPAWADETVTVNGDSFKVFSDENVMDKIVTVKNNGNIPAYVRTIVALEAGKTAEQAKQLWYNNIAVTDNSDNGETITSEDNDLFVKIGDDYYIIVVYTYKNALAAETESAASLTGVGLYAKTTQDQVKDFGGDYEVLVISQAVQANGMGDDAGAALDKAFGDVDATNVAAWFAAVA